MAQPNGFPAAADGLAPQMQVDEIGRRGTIMADQVPHQDIENVVIDYYSNDHYSRKNRIASRLRSTLPYSHDQIRQVRQYPRTRPE